VIAGGILLVLLVAAWGLWRVKNPAPSADAIWRRAQENFQAARYEDVAADLNRLSALRQPTASDWFLRAELAAINDHLDEALADLDKVPDAHPLAAQGRLIAGQIERRRDRLGHAERALLDAVRLDPSLVQAHRELARIYGLQLRRPEFNREFKALQRLTLLSFDDVYHWTSVRNNLWVPGAVVDDLTRFVAADPADRWTRLALADILRRMSRLTEAESTIAALPQDDPDVIALRAQMALDSQNDKEAERLLSSGPRDHLALARLRGRCALARRDAEESVREFRIAYAADTDDPETLSGLRVAYSLTGNETEAKRFREAAANVSRLNSLLPRGRAVGARKDLELLREFAITCAALDRDDEARAWIGLAIAADPLDSKSQQVLFRLGAANRPGPDPDRRKP
jgi:tetratricopeptide (TPR) repeat protein